MVEIDHSDTLRVVTELTSSSSTYARHFTLWLGLGSAGGAVAMLSFVADLPDPDYALRALLPAFGAFALGVVAAASSVLMAARRDNAGAEHYGRAYNRDQLNAIIKQTREWLSSVPAQAERMNAGRNSLVTDSKAQHEQAERAWRSRTVWSWSYRVCTGISALAFIVGITWPLTFVATGQSLKPPPPKPMSISIKKPVPAIPKPAPAPAIPGA
jgi:hypothetical protein